MTSHRCKVTRRTVLTGLAALASAGCERQRPDNRLRVAYSPPRLKDLYEGIAAAFRKEHPGIDVELVPAATYQKLMERDFRLALVDDEPDVSHIGLHHVGFYAERGLTTPLQPFLDREPSGTLTAHPTIGHVGGVLRALPFAVSLPVSYFNLSLFQRCGVRPEALIEGNWETLVDAAATVNRQRPPGSSIYFDYNAESALGWQMLICGRGGQLLSPDGARIAFNDAAGLWSARTLAELGRAGQIDMSRENARMAFLAGTLGCYQNTSANFMHFSSSRTDFELGVATLPVLPERGRLPAAGNALIITTRNPARHELAWRYIRFATGAMAQAAMASSTGYLTLNRQAVEDSRVRRMLDAQPIYRSLYRRLALLVPWQSFPGPRSTQISDQMNDTMRDLLLGRVAPRTGLDAMSQQAQRFLDRS